MKVVRFDNEGPTNRSEYETQETDIRKIAQEYGHAFDTLELYDDAGELVAIATWPQGWRVYKYCTGENLDPNPSYRVFVL